MQTQWIGKNADLDLLSKRIEGFFEDKGFKMKLEQSGDTYTLLGVLRRDDERESITVRVKGNSKDFLVEFLGKIGRFSILLSSFVSILGGGALILGKLKSQDFYEKLERDFWSFAEETVEQLTGSARDVS